VEFKKSDPDWQLGPFTKDKWLEALRSKDYVQGRKRLRYKTSNEDTYCCLGVLCDLIDPEAWETDMSWRGKPFDMSFEIIPWSVQADLQNMNDHLSMSFEEIADWIEENL